MRASAIDKYAQIKILCWFKVIKVIITKTKENANHVQRVLYSKEDCADHAKLMKQLLNKEMAPSNAKNQYAELDTTMTEMEHRKDALITWPLPEVIAEIGAPHHDAELMKSLQGVENVNPADQVKNQIQRIVITEGADKFHAIYMKDVRLRDNIEENADLTDVHLEDSMQKKMDTTLIPELIISKVNATHVSPGKRV